MTSRHIPLMTDEVLDALNAENAGLFLDCTLGGGGHSRAILGRNQNNKVFAIDRDHEAIERSKTWSDEYQGRFTAWHLQFSRLQELFQTPQFNGILADLGVSDDHLFGDPAIALRKPECAGHSWQGHRESRLGEIVGRFGWRGDRGWQR